MDGDNYGHSLIQSFLDPPDQPQKKFEGNRKRYRRCRTAPSVDLLQESHKALSQFPGPQSNFSNLYPNFKEVGLCLVIYLTLGSLCFYLVRNKLDGKKTNELLDALYFCIVTMTTVGYGDLVPKSTAAKLLACVFVFSGMAIVGFVLNKAADYLAEKQEVLLVRALHPPKKDGEAKMLREIETNRVRYKLIIATVVLLVAMLLGTLFLVEVEKFGVVDAFYCVCCTITTLGYGDKSFSTKGGRAFAVFWILTSTISLANFFLYLTELSTERRQRSLANWVLHRRMTFVDLEAADLDDDGSVSAAEFIIYKLKEMGKITQEDIALVLEEFEQLDADQSGTISTSDLAIAQSNDSDQGG